MAYPVWTKNGDAGKGTDIPPNLKQGCWLTGQDSGNNSIRATKECLHTGGQARCTECIRYIQFYDKVDALEEAEIRFGDAVRMAKAGRGSRREDAGDDGQDERQRYIS